MLKKVTLRIVQCAIITSVMFSTIGFAKDEGIPKVNWIKEFKLQAPAAICNRLVNGPKTSQILKSHNITYENCVAAIPKSINHCGDHFYAKLPKSLNADSGKKWGAEIGKCIGVYFYGNYIAGHQ